jgi:hypothetical protein
MDFFEHRVGLLQVLVALRVFAGLDDAFGEFVEQLAPQFTAHVSFLQHFLQFLSLLRASAFSNCILNCSKLPSHHYCLLPA